METIIKQEPIRTVYTDGTVVISNIRDPRTNEMVSYTVRNTWYDGTPMNDTKVDSFGVFTKYRPTGEYVRKNLPNWGLNLLEVDTVAQLRSLDPYLLHLIKVGYYNGVKLNGYYTKNDTPKPLNYYVSTTSKADDGGSVFALGSVKIEHKFDILYPEYFGSRGDGISDDTTPMQKVFGLLNTFKKLNLERSYLKKSKITWVGENIGGYEINCKGRVINDDCDGFDITANYSQVEIKTELINSPSGTRNGILTQGTSTTYNLTAMIRDATSNWNVATEQNKCFECSFKILARGRGATMATEKKGIGILPRFGINNSYISCKTLYTYRGLYIPVMVPEPGVAYTNEGSTFDGCHFLASDRCVEINPVTFVTINNCVIDLADTHALYLNGVSRSNVSNCWMGVTNNYKDDPNFGVVVTSSKGVMLSNIVFGTPRANGIVFQNSQNIFVDNIYNGNVNGQLTSFRINSDCSMMYIASQLVNFNIQNLNNSRILNYGSANYNQNITSLGNGLVPSTLMTNKFGSRIMPLGGQLTNVLEVFSSSDDANANNFQIGKTNQGLLVRHSGTGGWETKVISTYPIDTPRKGTTSERPTALHATKDIGFEYFDTTLIKPIWWKGSGWVDSSGGAV